MPLPALPGSPEQLLGPLASMAGALAKTAAPAISGRGRRADRDRAYQALAGAAAELLIQYALARQLAPTGWRRLGINIWTAISDQRTTDRLIAAFVKVVDALVAVEMVGTRRVRPVAGRLSDVLFGSETTSAMQPGVPQERFDEATSAASSALRDFIVAARIDRWWHWRQWRQLRRSMQ